MAHVTMTVTPAFEQDGSIGADTVKSRLLGVEAVLEIEAEAAPAEVARLVRTAERMCFMVDAIRNPHALDMRVALNDAPLAVAD